jgi:hypothetical protein
MYAVDNICAPVGQPWPRDLWTVNVEEEYHEEKKNDSSASGTAPAAGTGRAAPILPRKKNPAA